MTPAHLQALFEIEHGANVFDDGLAQLLWEVHEADPDLLQILDHAAMRGVPGFLESDLVDDHGKPCHFGAILKPKGVELVARKRSAALRAPESIESWSIKFPDIPHDDRCMTDIRLVGECIHTWPDKTLGREIIQSAMQDDLPNEPAFQPPNL